MKSLIEHVYSSSPVFLQNLMVTVYGYKLFRKRYSGIYNQIRELVQESRFWTEDQTEAYQSEKLHYMIRHCRQNVPYYQELFSQYGLHENDFTSTNDLQRLPILSKQTLRENSTKLRSSSTKAFIRQHTSGSTGTPLTVEINEYTYKLAMALLVDHEEFHGIPFGAKRATFAGRMLQASTSMRPPFSRFNKAENQALFSSYHLNSETFPWYQRALDKFQPLELIGYPSAICDLAENYQRTGACPQFTPSAIVTNSETLLDWQREIIESTFSCKVFDYYGTAEYVIFAGQNKSGTYSVNPIIGITELLEYNSENSPGRLISTSLTNHCMPLLRYDLGDSAANASIGTGKSVLREIDKIYGRIDDYLFLRDGRKVGRIDHIFKGVTGVKEAQVVQDKIDHCIIKIVKNSRSGPDNHKIIENFNQRTGNKINAKIEYVSSIPRGANGKFRSVVNRMVKG